LDMGYHSDLLLIQKHLNTYIHEKVNAYCNAPDDNWIQL
jgi:hypothetical protein